MLQNTRMIWTIFTKILVIGIQTKNAKKLIVFDGIIADMLSSKELYLIITALFVSPRKLNISTFYIGINELIIKLLSVDNDIIVFDNIFW